MADQHGDPMARLFCFPYAGGSSIAYHAWSPFEPGVELVTPDYPGSLMRPGAGFAMSVPDLVARLYQELVGQWDRPFVLCGSSLGGIVAFELARAAEAEGHCPAAVVVAASAAPSRLPRFEPIAGLEDEAFVRAVARRYGGAIGRVLDDPEALALALPAMRADIGLFEGYDAHGVAPVSSPIIAVAGADDATATYEDMAQWREFTTGAFQILSVPGDHFLVQSNAATVTDTLRHALRQFLPRGATGPATFPMPRDNPFDPPPEYARLREEAPVVRARMTTGKCHEVWLVTGYEEACAVLADTRFSSDSRLPGFPLVREYSTLIRMDPPDHTHYRRLLIPEFLNRQVAQLRPDVQKLTNGLLDAAVGSTQPVDLVPALAMPLPSLVICRLLGVPYDDHEFLQDRTAVALRMTSTDEETERAVADLGEYMSEVVHAKTRQPTDDLLSRLVVDHVRAGRCSFHNAVDLARLLLVAGHVTTVNMIGLGILALLQHPEQMADLRKRPHLVGDAVDELLRYLSVAGSVGRVATADVKVGDELIRAGDGIMVLLAVANRDPSAFADPDRLDIHRRGKRNLAFGFGPHHCIGASLARLELDIVLTTVLRRFPSLRPAVPVEDIPFRHHMRIYGVHALPVYW